MRAPLVLVLLLVYFLGGCASVANPRQSAYLTLFDPIGKLNTAAFQAALEARFVPGSGIKPLVDYTHSMDGFEGSCSAPDADGAMTCEAEIERCEYKWSATLKVSDDIIQTIKFDLWTVICD